MSVDVQIARLAASYPRQTWERSTIEAYAWGLHDLDEDDVEAAVVTAVRTLTFPPSIAELRLLVARRRLAYPTAAEALELVERFVSGGDPLPLPAPAARALKALGGSWSWKASEQPNVTRAHFLRLYDEYARAAVEEITVGQLPGGDDAKPQLEA